MRKCGIKKSYLQVTSTEVANIYEKGLLPT